MIELIWDSLEWLPDVLETLLKNHDVPPVIARLIAWIIPIISTIMIIRKQLKKKGSLEDIQEIKAMLRYQIEREGGTWDVDLNSFNNATTKPLSNYSPRSLVHTVGSIMKKMAIPGWGSRLRRKSKMANKFKSRKFWMAVITGILVVLNDGLELGIDQETVLAFAGIIATYIIGEAAVDATRKPKVVSAQSEIAASSESDEEVKLF